MKAALTRSVAGSLFLFLMLPGTADAAARLSITIERPIEGAPITLGVPFPRGALGSPDHVRVLTTDGREVPSQITEVTTWEPVDPSVKWIWVFFFAERADRYVLEYGDDVRHTLAGRPLEIVNNQRSGGLLEVTSGALRFVVQQGETGFLRDVQLDLGGDGFDAGDVIAVGPAGRGSFVDLVDDAGVDASRAFVRQTFIERGSGPMHAVLRVEGEYRYGRSDNAAAPFVIRIHAYADRPYIKVQHTLVYTGVADKHRPQAGDYPHVATQPDAIITPDTTDTGWTVPEDRIAGAGLSLALRLSGPRQVTAGWRDGRWWAPGESRRWRRPLDGEAPLSLAQTGPKPDRIPPVPESSPTEHLEGFVAELASGSRVLERAERAEGWMDVSDEGRGVAMGIRHFLEEYPKALDVDPSGEARALIWSPGGDPMSFARSSNRTGSEGAIENWAQGTAKTSELVFFFHGRATEEEIARTTAYVLTPPVAHAEPAWYGQSGVYGRFAPSTGTFPEYERSIDYKFDWVLFNQRWIPWYGMFDYGDVKVDFDGRAWRTWGHNEPAQDFMVWLQFMRTGDPRFFDAAQAFSRHTMDVDNTHWPTGPTYLGDSNYPLDYWRSLDAPPATKFLGIGRRHTEQHSQHVLSAHVWVQGWLADYYLAADHRGLDVAVQTAEMHLRRLWGEHELTGRRLYLSLWNLVEVWDATKSPRYAAEVEDRLERLLRLQFDQGGNLAIDRFGYAQIYATQALGQYLAMTGDRRAETALVRHARWARDVIPLNHWTESYLSSVHGLAIGYELTGDPGMLAEMKRRIEDTRTDALPRPIDDSWTQEALFAAFEAASHLPPDPNRHRSDVRRPGPARPGPPQPRRAGWAVTNGLRVFGWTHIFSLPYALAVLGEESPPAGRGRRP